MSQCFENQGNIIKTKDKLHAGVLKRYEKYKEIYKLKNIIYGKKAINKMSTIMYPHDNISRKNFKNKYKDNNAVYFILNKKKL